MVVEARKQDIQRYVRSLTAYHKQDGLLALIYYCAEAMAWREAVIRDFQELLKDAYKRETRKAGSTKGEGK